MTVMASDEEEDFDAMPLGNIFSIQNTPDVNAPTGTIKKKRKLIKVSEKDIIDTTVSNTENKHIEALASTKPTSTEKVII